MTHRVRVAEVELDAPPETLGNLEDYEGLRVLVRLHGTPIGQVELPLFGHAFAPADLKRILLRRLYRQVIRHHLLDLLQSPLPPGGVSFEELLDVPHLESEGPRPLVTVAVCTRDRAEDLRLCLDALGRLEYPRLEILVVDNAPNTDATERLVTGSYPHVRYVREERPGLDWARNRAIAEASGEILAYTDDDVLVDPGWLDGLVAGFSDPEVAAVTGLIVPYELETEAQVLFERYGGFGRGFERKYWQMDLEGGERPWHYLGSGKYGTGANMAYRRSVFGRVGPFDPALDVGTVTNGGGDLEMFFRILKEGYPLVYEPDALVRHRHRRDYAQLHAQLTNNGIGLYSYLIRTALAYPDARGDVVSFGLWWFWYWDLRRLIGSYIRPQGSYIRPHLPRDLILAELKGALVGLGRYPQARRKAARIAPSDASILLPAPPQERAAKREAPVGVRMVDLCRPLRGLDDVMQYSEVRVFASLDGRLIGSVDVANRHQAVSAARLREALVDHLGLRLLGQDPELSPYTLWDNARAALRQRYLLMADGGTVARLTDDVSVSVVVATYDRPDDLRNCLRHLTAQETARPVEIVVADNHPASGLTPPVIHEFPRVVLVNEPRQGLAYARNKGFTASTGEIALTTDDDVSAPPDWVERLVAPFVRPDVMAVTGNTLPLELESSAQRSFERYGGLGRGFVPKEADSLWFGSFRRRAVPTWELGATANAAFRASIFHDPEIGLMDEALGPGTPTGVGEDTYLFYKVLKAGYTIVYEPSAYVWHRHRREMSSLRNQMYNYSKGHVAYHLTTLLRDRDLRAVGDLVGRLPGWHVKNLARYAKRRLLGRRIDHPLQLLLTEVRGNLAGPWSLWKSHQRAGREGRSDPYVPVSQRSAVERRLHGVEMDP